MFATLEVRWFLPGPLPDAVDAWFESLGPALDVEARTDRYLLPTSEAQPGIKVREGKLETKARTAIRGQRRFTPGVVGVVEAFRKWSFPLAPEAEQPQDGWIDVAKRRRVRRYRWRPDRGLEETRGYPPSGCGLEVGEVQLGERVWWTVCLEAFGTKKDTREERFRQTAAFVFERADAPVLERAYSRGYVGWLAQDG